MDQAEGLRSSSDDEDSTHHATKRRGCNQTMTETGTEEVLGCREAEFDQPWWVSLIEARISSSSTIAATGTATNPQMRRRMKVLSSCTGTCVGGARHLTSTLGARAGAVSCGVSALELFDELLVGCDACDVELLDLLCFFVCCFTGGVRDVFLCVYF